MELVLNAIIALEIKPTHIIHGGATGADFWGAIAAQTLGLQVTEFKADWALHGKAAGPIRNQQMLEQNPDLVLAFHPESGITKGTKDMVTRARIHGVPVKIVKY
jgi:hypothetical protein